MIHRDSNAITVTDSRGVAHVPAAALSVLLIGPGVRITHSAIAVLAESGSTAVWVGENGVRYYAHGNPPSRSSRLLEAQARAVSDPTLRIAAARKMYLKRFIGEDVSKLSLQQLRGREGARVRRLYRFHSKRTGVPWDGREFDPDNYEAGTAVNKGLSAANTALYGVIHAVVVALGCSPGLGFVHCGNYRSFVYDIADLYKADLSIPIAFDVAAIGNDVGIGSEARIRMRDAIKEHRVLDRAVKDIKDIVGLGEDSQLTEDQLIVDDLYLWDDSRGIVEAGISYSVR